MGMICNLKFIPTKRLNTILADPYTRGIDGKDYGPLKEELQDIVWGRAEKQLMNFHALAEKELKDYEDFLDSEGVPSVTSEIFNETFYAVN